MSDVAIGPVTPDETGFRLRTVLLMLAVGIGGFIAMLALAAYAPALRSGRDGGGHALSVGGIGLAGIVQLINADGGHAVVVRDPHMLVSEDLLVATPDAFSDTAALDKLLAARGARPTLIVLPKWAVAPDPAHRGWVTRPGGPLKDSLLADIGVASAIASLTKVDVQRRPSDGLPFRATGALLLPRLAIPARHAVQTISGRDLVPLLVDGGGRVVLARHKPMVYILAEPDLLANWQMGDAHRAAAALALLDSLNSTGAETIGFDVTLNGFGRTPSLLRLLFDPPFLAATLALGTALLLTGIHAFGRFGSPRRRERAIAFGKTALIDNSAALVRMARREAALGNRYAAAMRERAAAAFGAPARLRDAELDAYLDRLERGRRFTDLAQDLAAAEDRQTLLTAAQTMHDWGSIHR